jgi:pilus assembly protein CpaB
MQRRLLTVLLFAFVVAAASSTILYKVISANSRVSAGTAPLTKILVAAKDLQAGAVVGQSDVRSIDWSAAVSPQWARSMDDIAGRALVAGVNQGEPFPENRLAPKGAGGGLAFRIPSGMRAVAVHVDELSGISRYIVSGTRVDVLSTGSGPQSASMVSRTILQNIQVLSTGQDVERNSKEQPAAVQTVNLLVTPEQAEVLGLAVAQNRIQLVLRNPLDTSRVSATPVESPAANAVSPKKRAVTVAAVRTPITDKAATSTLPAVQPKLEAPTVEVIHGTKKVVSSVGLAENQDTKQ